jgi:hypothetical protein
MLKFAMKIFHIMNLQSILTPIAHGCKWFFQHVMEPLGNTFSIVCILGAFFGIDLWIRMQKRFTAEAKKNGTLI